MINFNIDAVDITEFGIERNDNDNTLTIVPTDKEIKDSLLEMVKITIKEMQRIYQKPMRYEPSEKYSASEYLYLPIDDNLAYEIKLLHEARYLEYNSKIFSNPEKISGYFAHFKDKNGKYLTAYRRAAQFKGIIKSRLIRFFDDSLEYAKDKYFKLDLDFDFIVDSSNIYILHPDGFESAGKLKTAILRAVTTNIIQIKKAIPFVDFEGISEYAKEHIRAARCLASVLMKEKIDNINKDELKKLCRKTGVDISETNGKIKVSKGAEMGFLEVLDRRRYKIELIKGRPEKFKAGNRTQLG